MSISPGTRFGPYEVLALVSAGGMSACGPREDTASRRAPQRECEAQVLASLNHPNIAAIYGLEKADGLRASRGRCRIFSMI